MVPLQEKKFIYDKVYEILGEIVFIVQILLSLLVLIFILYTISQNIREQTTQYGPMLLKMGMVVLALSTYHFWTVEIADLIVEIAHLIDSKGQENYDVSSGNFRKLYEKYKKYFYATFEIQHELAILMIKIPIYMMEVARLFFEFMQFFFQAILWVFGPIAIVVSLIPMYADNFKRWLRNFIVVNFWSVIYTVLMILFYHLVLRLFEYYFQMISKRKSGFTETLELAVEGYLIAFKLCGYAFTFFILILLIPLIAEFILPHVPDSTRLRGAPQQASARVRTVIQTVQQIFPKKNP